MTTNEVHFVLINLCNANVETEQVPVLNNLSPTFRKSWHKYREKNNFSRILCFFFKLKIRSKSGKSDIKKSLKE